MAGPENEMTADGGRGRLRASHADREHVVGTLKAAYVHGLVTKDEFDARVSRTFASRTYAELARITADIPAGLAAAPPPLRPGPAPASSRAVANLTPGERAIIGHRPTCGTGTRSGPPGRGSGRRDCWPWRGSAALSYPRSSSEPRCAAHGATSTPGITGLHSGQLTAVRERAAGRPLLPRQNRSRTLASPGGAATLTLPCAIR